MAAMDSNALRRSFLDYFKGKGHTIVESAPLVPAQDQTLLFTNAGMVQFKEALALRETRSYARAVSCQRCVRAGGKHNDLDNVGYTARHHTFFEMLGNFSFGDYFKAEAIAYAHEYLTQVIGLPEERLWVTVHDSDDEAERIWTKDIGFDPARITRLGDADNFWAMGETGPCGPCSEIFWDHGPEVPGGPPGSPEAHQDRYIELWNLVFTQYDKGEDGALAPLAKASVDTGMGFERLAAVLEGVHDNYAIDLFQALISHAAGLLGTSDLQSPSLKVIADHARCAAFLIADGVIPGNEGRGYVLRRIIRRALRHGHKLGHKPDAAQPFFHQMAAAVAQQMSAAYPLLAKAGKQVERLLRKEEEQFALTLDQGMKVLDEALKGMQGKGMEAKTLPGDLVFKLYDTYGFPADLTADIARERGMKADLAGFDAAMDGQRTRARAASQFASDAHASLGLAAATEFLGYDSLAAEATVVALLVDGKPRKSVKSGEALLALDRTPFYAEAGGQVGDAGSLKAKGLSLQVLDAQKDGEAIVHRVRVEKGEVSVGQKLQAQVAPERRAATRLNHTATHLLHAALRQTLGEHVTQRGSLVDAQRLRFDFSHFDPLTQEEVRRLERLVNGQIRANTEVQTAIMPLDAAKAAGALALFGEKYAEEVRVLSMGDGFSVELCGGTHASRTGDLGLFKITLEQGVASGVRRLEAVTGAAALAAVEAAEDALAATAASLKADKSQVPEKAAALAQQNRQLQKEVAALGAQLATGGAEDLASKAQDLGGFKLLVHQMQGADPKTLPDALDRLKSKLGSAVVVLATVSEGKVSLVAGVTKDLTDRLDAKDLVNHIAAQVGGKGGGRPDMARAGGSNPKALPKALASLPAHITAQLPKPC